jgi:hypothetical protein
LACGWAERVGIFTKIANFYNFKKIFAALSGLKPTEAASSGITKLQLKGTGVKRVNK